MSETSESQGAQAPSTAAPRQTMADPPSVIIRPWPKVVFLYPTFIVSTIFWFIQLLSGGGDAPAEVVAPAPAPDPAASGESIPADDGGTGSFLGNVWMTVFALNLLVFAFDFSRIKSITIFVGMIAVGFALAWADTTWGVLGGIKSVLGTIDIQMNAQFYGFMSAFLFFVLLLVLVNTRFNYYEVNHREILHHHGYLGDITRMPTQGLRFNKEIYDLLEYVLLRSGRLIFYPSTSREAIVVDNVIGVNKVENHIKDLLSVVAVRVTDELP